MQVLDIIINIIREELADLQAHVLVFRAFNANI